MFGLSISVLLLLSLFFAALITTMNWHGKYAHNFQTLLKYATRIRLCFYSGISVVLVVIIIFSSILYSTLIFQHVDGYFYKQYVDKILNEIKKKNNNFLICGIDCKYTTGTLQIIIATNWTNKTQKWEREKKNKMCITKREISVKRYEEQQQ